VSSAINLFEEIVKNRQNASTNLAGKEMRNPLGIFDLRRTMDTEAVSHG